MKRVDTPLPGVSLIVPDVHRDDRGYFLESFHSAKFEALGITTRFVQHNQSRSFKNVLRGLHFQHPRGMAKLVRVTQGAIWDVAVDVRLGSPTFGMHFATELNDTNHHQLFIPEGFAHGFCVLSEVADVAYANTGHYSPDDERRIAWNDPELRIPWPVENPVLSPADLTSPRLRKVTLPRMTPF